MPRRSSVVVEQPSEFALELLKSLAPQLVKSEKRSSKQKQVTTTVIDPFAELEKDDKQPKSFSKSILNVLDGGKNSIERLAFEVDPSLTNTYSGVYKQKHRLLPDAVLKRIQIQDDLVAAIVNARASQVATFGRKRPTRHDFGFVFEINDGIADKLSDEQMAQLQKRIDLASVKLQNCGNTKGWDDEESLTFSQYLSMSTKNAVGLGRIATEIIWVENPASGEKEFHSFRPIDAGTIYKAAPQKEAAQAVREQALHLLEQVKNKDLQPERFVNDEYAWVQVIDNRPVQAFTSRECVVHNFYPVADVELDGYPVTPLDTVISAVTTHINIVSHNKLYFQSGRAARGMLVIKSDDIGDDTIAAIRQQFNASINSVGNAWRMPVFAIGPEDEITWQPIDSGSRDMEFQYLSDSNARVILSAFQMSPEELPGYAHLSRGTNNQALSESNNEYLLLAHRDVGIRPLVSQWEDFINKSLFPLIDPNLAKICTIKLKGLDAETAEKESIRLTQDAPVHMTYDEVLDKVEKKPVGKEMGGEFPLNPGWQAIADKYLTVGTILERFFNVPGASRDPRWAYVRDPFWFQWQQLQMQAQQMQMQAQQQQAGGQPPPGGDGGGGGGGDGGGSAGDGGSGGDSGSAGGGSAPPGGGGDGSDSASASSADQEDQLASAQASDDIGRSIDQATAMLSKSERSNKLRPNSRRILSQHNATVEHLLHSMKEESKHAIRAIINVADKHIPKHTRQ
jgi:hypothetical protein